MKYGFYKYITASALVLLLLSCESKEEKAKREALEEERARIEKELLRQKAVEKAKDTAVSGYVDSLSLEQKVSQLFLINIEGNTSYYSVERQGSLYGKRGEGDPLLPGGCLLFSYNISKDKDQLYKYIKSIRDYYISHNQVPPYISVDQEGGDVNRLRGVTSTLYSQKKISDTFTPEAAQEIYKSQGEQMKLLGFDLNLSPVVEVLNPLNEGFLDTRSFGSLDKVCTYGKVSITGYQLGGTGVVLKHFPGNTNTDPHTGLPEIRVDEKTLNEVYLAPFETLLKQNCDAVLMSHARVTVTDSDKYGDGTVPACLSSFWVNDMLRKKYGYRGIIFSDDIFMGALNANGFSPEKACIMAIDAGIDCIMLSEKTFGRVGSVIIKKMSEDESFAQRVYDSVKRVIMFKISHGILEMEDVSSGEEDGEISFIVKSAVMADTYDHDLWSKSFSHGMEILK